MVPGYVPELFLNASSTKDKLVSLLSVYPYLSTRRMHHLLKKQYATNITYQAVHKTLKQMVKQGVLQFDGKNYSINPGWINRLRLFVEKINNNNDNKLKNIKRIDYGKILDMSNKDTINFVLQTRKEFDQFYFKIRIELIKLMNSLPKTERIVFHHIGHLYISLSHPTEEHEFIEDLKKTSAKAYYFVKGDGPVDQWATKIYNNSPVTIFLGSRNELTRLILLYPTHLIEIYYSQRTNEIFRRLYERKWSIEQVKMGELFDELYTVNDPIQIIINKDPLIIDTIKKFSTDLLSKHKISELRFLKTIEEIITERDIKGVSKLREYLPKHYCKEAANYILDNKGNVIIITGFYVRGRNTAETDGLIGAVFLAKALEKIGCNVTFITDMYASPILCKLAKNRIIEFPITTLDESEKLAEKYIREINPNLIISIERAGLSESGRYYNIRSKDITKHTAKLDPFFTLFDKTISIADTGNEIGMGNLINEIKKEIPSIVPSKTKTKHLILGTTTNWATYGLIIALSILSNKKLVRIDEVPILKKIIKLGGVDGLTKKKEISYDSFTPLQSKEIIDSLQAFISD
ncbi:DUF4392 domain-containing protein [Candidatus Woesearchaeota archaeon]|nr:DUF4392 domain-containing protein [Candidatus Woesearchaeota archaeon]